jgi:DNA-binding LacI/PurR family transcriptional regulator/DNA-binding transcriptional regulator YhcF (GntR family)
MPKTGIEIQACLPKRPKYRQVMEYLHRRILNGTYPVGSKLSSVRDLSRELELSPATTSRAIQELARAGIVTTYPGAKGTIVTCSDPTIQTKPTTLACLTRAYRPRGERDNFSLDVLDGARKVVSEHGYRHVLHCLDEVDYEQRMVELAQEDWVCGVLVDGSVPASVVRRLTQLGLPIAMFGRFASVPNLSCAMADYVHAARESVQILLNKGYERLGYSAIQADHDQWDELMQTGEQLMDWVYKAFRGAATAQQVAEEDLVVFVEPSINEPLRGSPEAFGLPRRKGKDWRPLGIFANYDRRAVWLLEAIEQTDLVLGKDIGVIGCRNLTAARRSARPPSTWRVDRAAIGAAVATDLIARIENSGIPASNTRIPMEFIDRGTA